MWGEEKYRAPRNHYIYTNYSPPLCGSIGIPVSTHKNYLINNSSQVTEMELLCHILPYSDDIYSMYI